jgi:hypothetical protein
MLTTNAEQKRLLIGMTDIRFQDPRNFPNGLRIIVRAVACDVVPFEKIDIESITEERRKSVAKSIRIASVEELKKLGDEVFPDLDDPWRETYFNSSQSTATPLSIMRSQVMASICFIAETKTEAFGLCRERERGFCRQQVAR